MKLSEHRLKGTKSLDTPQTPCVALPLLLMHLDHCGSIDLPLGRQMMCDGLQKKAISSWNRTQLTLPIKGLPVCKCLGALLPPHHVKQVEGRYCPYLSKA